MIRKATAMRVRQNLGELLNEVQYRHDTVLVTKGGKPVAALIDIDLFERIRSMKEQFNRLTDEFTTAYADVNPKTVALEISEAIRSARKK